MKTSVQAHKARNATANSINHMSGMYDFSSNGRVYQSEKYSGPLEPRATAILPREVKMEKINERVKPQAIRAVERYLGRTKAFPTAEIVEEYNLIPNPQGLQYSKGDGQEVFKHLCNKYPLAHNYKGWCDIYYSMMNCFPVRKEPLKITKIDVNEHFAIDDCKPIYSKDEMVYIVHYNDDKRLFNVYEANVVSYYIKKLNDDSFDIMYQLRSECYGSRKTGWKLQGSKSIFDNMDEAINEAKERNIKL